MSRTEASATAGLTSALPGQARARESEGASLQRRRYALVLDCQADVIPRVTGLCARKRARIVSLRFTAADRPAGSGDLEIEVEVPARQGRSLRKRLDALVQVRSVVESP